MRMAAILVLTIMLGLPQANATDPATPIDLTQPTPAIKAAESNQPEQPRRPAAPRLDPSACAELCRLFERMWSLEKRIPEAPVPTS